MKIKVILISLVLAAALLATGCPERTTIGKISANPSRYVGKQTVVAGTVKNSFGIPFLGGAYKLDDGTGSIWVVTSKSVPSKGSQVGVKGEVQDGVNFSGKNYGLGIMENERRIK